MMPGINQRQMAQAMKRMGIAQKEIDAVQVIIKCSDKELVFENPQVAAINMMGQSTYQIIGTPHERALSSIPLTIESTISEEDIQVVVEQTGATSTQARATLEKHDGDLAGAILELKK